MVTILTGIGLLLLGINPLSNVYFNPLLRFDIIGNLRYAGTTSSDRAWRLEIQMSEKKIQEGSGVCERCFMVASDLEKHDVLEHGFSAPVRELTDRERERLLAQRDLAKEFAESFVYMGEKTDNRGGK